MVEKENSKNSGGVQRLCARKYKYSSLTVFLITLSHIFTESRKKYKFKPIKNFEKQGTEYVIIFSLKSPYLYRLNSRTCFKNEIIHARGHSNFNTPTIIGLVSLLKKKNLILYNTCDVCPKIEKKKSL